MKEKDYNDFLLEEKLDCGMNTVLFWSAKGHQHSIYQKGKLVSMDEDVLVLHASNHNDLENDLAMDQKILAYAYCGACQHYDVAVVLCIVG